MSEKQLLEVIQRAAREEATSFELRERQQAKSIWNNKRDYLSTIEDNNTVLLNDRGKPQKLTPHQDFQYPLFIAQVTGSTSTQGSRTSEPDLLNDPSLLLTIIGTIISSLGLLFSVGAWWEARRAKKAANNAANQVRVINAVVDTSRLERICDECITLLDNDAYQDARSRVREIRNGVIQFKSQRNTKKHLKDDEWTEITTELANLDDKLNEALAGNGSANSNAYKKVIRRVNELLVCVALKVKTEAEILP